MKVSENLKLACDKVREVLFGNTDLQKHRSYVVYKTQKKICNTKFEWLSQFLEKEKRALLNCLSYCRKTSGRNLKQAENKSKLLSRKL